MDERVKEIFLKGPYFNAHFCVTERIVYLCKWTEQFFYIISPKCGKNYACDYSNDIFLVHNKCDRDLNNNISWEVHFFAIHK